LALQYKTGSFWRVFRMIYGNYRQYQGAQLIVTELNVL
jgi:hypothetical protein